MSAGKVRIWDLPTRVFHWLVVLLVAGSWLTHEIGRLDLHIKLGLTMLGLVLFRIFWGLIGGSTARFAGFVRGPRTVIAYVRGRGGRAFGHNPLGGWSVVLMLLALAMQVGLGLFVTDEDGLNSGPLSHLISYDSARILAERHETMFYVLLALVAVHVGAILYYLLVKRDDLVTPMVTGRKKGEGEALRPASASRFLLAAGLALSITLAIAFIL